MSLKQSVHIEAPVEKVFDFFKNPKNFRGVSEDFVIGDVKMTQEGVGTNYTWITKVAGLAIEGFDVYTEFVPNKRITDKSSRFGTWTYSFEPEGSGMKITMEIYPRSFWRIPPMDKILGRAIAKRSERFWPKVTASMEG